MDTAYIEWSLNIEGLDELSEGDKLYILALIGEKIGLFGELEGSFEVTKED